MSWSEVVHENRKRAELQRAREELRLRRRGYAVEVCVVAGPWKKAFSTCCVVLQGPSNIRQHDTAVAPPRPMQLHVVTPADLGARCFLQEKPSAGISAVLTLAGALTAGAWWRKEGRKPHSRDWKSLPGELSRPWLCLNAQSHTMCAVVCGEEGCCAWQLISEHDALPPAAGCSVLHKEPSPGVLVNVWRTRDGRAGLAWQRFSA